MMIISKSKFMAFKTCPKSLWMMLNMPEQYVEDPTAQKHIDDGHEVGEYAKGYFENTVDTTTYKEDGSLDMENMIGLTNRYLLQDKVTIAEASFSIDGLFCSVDLLHKAEDGFEIYEVKATTNVEKEHCIDAAFQKYVLSKRGIDVKRVFILHLNNEYRRKGDINLQHLFLKDQIDDNALFKSTLEDIENDIERIKEIAKLKEEYEQVFLQECKACPFKKYCLRNIPSPSVVDINNIRGGFGYLNRGVITYSDVLRDGIKLNKRQKVQIEAYLRNNERVVDVPSVKAFLSTVRYPIYHLDFESIMLPIPPCDDAWPYEQIPTQYSLHIEYEDGRLEHKEFLGDSIDPRRGIAEALCRDIPMNACVLAYNKTFECGRIKELAELYPDLREHLENMKDNVVDLIVPFKSGAFYCLAMGGSNSIKAVLPALYPDDPELDYHALPVVHNGGEAMDIYPKMLLASPEERERIRDGLLKYCCLDTLAMVKVLRKVKQAVAD